MCNWRQALWPSQPHIFVLISTSQPNATAYGSVAIDSHLRCDSNDYPLLCHKPVALACLISPFRTEIALNEDPCSTIPLVIHTERCNGVTMPHHSDISDSKPVPQSKEPWRITQLHWSLVWLFYMHDNGITSQHLSCCGWSRPRSESK